MLVQLVVMIVSAFFSEYAWPAMGRVLVYLAEGIVLYFLILNTVRSEEMLRKAVWTVVLAGFLMGSLSLLQQISGSGKTFGGLAQIHVDRLESDTSDSTGKNVAQSGRASGTVGEENYYAQIMLMVLPLAASRFWFERTWLLRIMGALACVPIAGAIMLTFSRGAFISACAVVMAMVYLGCIKIRHLLMIGLAFVLVVPLVMPQYAYRILTIFRIVGVQPQDGGSGKTLDTSMRGRATENLAALNIFLDHPMLGVGPGQTQMYTAKYGDEEAITRLQGNRQAHNMYLGVLADTGVIGFLSLMPIFIFSLVGLMRVRRLYSETRPELVGLAIGLTLSLVAFLSSAVFLSAAYERFYWLIVALGAVAVQIAAREEEDPLAQPSLV
jgi:O-antigen ligase